MQNAKEIIGQPQPKSQLQPQLELEAKEAFNFIETCWSALATTQPQSQLELGLRQLLIETCFVCLQLTKYKECKTLEIPLSRGLMFIEEKSGSTGLASTMVGITIML